MCHGCAVPNVSKSCSEFIFKVQQSQTTHRTTHSHNNVQQSHTTHPTTLSQQGPTVSDYTSNNTVTTRSNSLTLHTQQHTVTTTKPQSSVTSLWAPQISPVFCCKLWDPHNQSAGMWHCAVGLLVPDVPEACSAIICHIKKYRNSSSWTTKSLHSFNPLAATHQMAQHHILDNLYFCPRLLQCPNIEYIISYKLTISAHLPSLGP
jgi:hypothetical protein